MSIILALLIFSLIIIIHELGHFLLAKYNGITVLEFSLGMGPRILSVEKGGTRYSWKLLPFGGSCMMLGEDDSTMEQGSFASKSVWARISVIAAGPIFNFFLAFFLSLFIVGSIGYDRPVVGKVQEGSPAAKAGIEVGDEIVKINGSKVKVAREVTNYSLFHGNDQEAAVTWKHNGELKTASITKELDKSSGRYLMGINMSAVREKGNPLDVLYYSGYEVKYWICTTIDSLKMLFGGRLGLNDMAGPVGVVDMIGDTYEQSKPDGGFYIWLNMLNISILLTANLGVMNLLPIPALDGGRLVFLFIEAIRRKRIDPEKEGMVHMIGLLALMALMVIVMFNDVRRLF